MTLHFLHNDLATLGIENGNVRFYCNSIVGTWEKKCVAKVHQAPRAFLQSKRDIAKQTKCSISCI